MFLAGLLFSQRRITVQGLLDFEPSPSVWGFELNGLYVVGDFGTRTGILAPQTLNPEQRRSETYRGPLSPNMLSPN